MIDIVTIVFREELEILRVQAQSIDLFCSPELVQNIIIVVNDTTEVADSIDTAWWGQFQDCVRIIPRCQFGHNWTDNGWVSQQVLKILGSAQAHSKWAQVMDAKTILVKPVDNSIWDAQGRLRSGSFDIYSVFYPARDIVNQLFDISLDRQIGPGGVPFFFDTDIVRSMITDVEKITGQLFVDWFQAQGLLTEFILYCGYILYCGDKHSSVYAMQNSAILPVNICHSEIGIFDIKLDQMLKQNPLTVSIHRNAWNKLSLLQKQQYRDFLISKNISTIGLVK